LNSKEHFNAVEIVSNQRASQYLNKISDESASHRTPDDKENGAVGSIVSDQRALILPRHLLQCNDTGRRRPSSNFRRKFMDKEDVPNIGESAFVLSKVHLP
jgi:hypothetical protein